MIMGFKRAKPKTEEVNAVADLIALHDIRKTYRMGEEVVHALDGVDLTINQGDFAAIVGSSGSGKSTLMHLLGFMDRPTSGKLFFDGVDVSRLSSGRRAWYRSNRIGFVFQAFNLLPRLSVMENVLLPVYYSRKSDPGSQPRAMKALERVGMTHRAKHAPSQLSGGERQRVAIARSLINQPRIILADEPTGNLDSRNVERIMELFQELRNEGQTVVLVTHDLGVAAYANRLITMRDGNILEDVQQ